MDPKEIVRTGYDRISHVYRADDIDYTRADHLAYVEWITELKAVLPQNVPVLDLGCGNGIPSTKLLAAAGFNVTGVDISPVQIKRAAALVPTAQFHCTDMMAVRFPAQSFAAIVSFYAIIHVPLAEQPALFAQIHEWLRPNGYLMVTVGATAWTGTEENWLDVGNATMYWSHADSLTYQQWLTDLGFTIHKTRFIPEGAGGHTLLLAQRGA
jgi:2-polyprenyl-3-methyl-5-hydroxy-6-metoxy-1,4-benzoquinol methylase